MSQYYNPKRTRNLFDPEATKPFNISRSKIDLFMQCPRCFYLDRRLGVGRPPGFPFTLNSAVDTLLKKEFDIHRMKETAHPLMKEYGIDAIPYAHKDLDIWRENFKGIRVEHEPTNLTISGAIDDVWITPEGELIIVDYKATAKNSEVNLDADWQIGYKRQMEVYQWLMRKKGFKVSDTGYFVYANGKTNSEAFNAKLDFDMEVLPYTGDDSWIDSTLNELHVCMSSDEIPDAGSECDYCPYRETAGKELWIRKKSNEKKNSTLFD
ncbi:hypothetical protein COB64_03185 [Candidatus Wolfebacteria bacterium]|nr:MAG: hypothetical protein COB64_03185 [Candidatus Wolfebacteria bacterium]